MEPWELNILKPRLTRGGGYIGNNPLHPGRKQRHWRTRADLVTQAVQRRVLTFEKIPTEDNLSDILTKPKGGEYFESMAREICGAEPLTLPGTNIDIRHKNRVVKEAKKERQRQQQKMEKQYQQRKSNEQQHRQNSRAKGSKRGSSRTR